MNKQNLSKAASLAGLAIAVLALVYLLKKDHLFSDNYIGMTIQVLAVALMLWARVTFGMRSFHAVANTTSGGLVTHGPYRWFRHPIYASIIYFVWAGVASYPYADCIIAAALVSLGLITRMLLEETFLRVAYPEYGAYSKQTKRIIPFIF
jgi:protein-S-isoprenylcysteine O-methyltransferase Ste14